MKYFTKALSILYVFFLLTSCKDQPLAPEKKEEIVPQINLNNKSVGESAHDLLASEDYNYLQVEIQYIQGYAPTQIALDNLKNFLVQRLNKPKGIEYIFTTVKSPLKSSYSVSEIAELEEKFRTVYTKGDTIGVYFFFADAGYYEDSDNSKVLGIAYRNTSMALFQKTIHSLSGGINQPERSKLETVVLNHEVGHILGLVNVGSPMETFHQDETHGKHCNNTTCLMHYTVETGNVISNILGGNLPELDENCLQDLKANGGK